MADILIRGMEMPKGCKSCKLSSDSHCNATGQWLFSTDLLRSGFNWKTCRLPDCPIVELPEHGDLIDRGEIVAHYRKCECNLGSDRHLEFLTVHDWIEEGIVYDLLIASVIVPSNKEDAE